MGRAIAVFSVAHGGIRLQVRLLPTVTAVDAQYRDGRRRRTNKIVHAFFQASRSAAARHHGTIVLAMDGELDELVPHEVAHAVIHCQRGISANDDEAAATAVGILSARIFAKARSLQGRTHAAA